LTFRNKNVTFRPQFGAPKVLRPGADVHPCPPSSRHCATTHCEPWTLCTNTEICTSASSAEILWVSGHSLISA